MNAGSKYHPLYEHLTRSGAAIVPMTFVEIETLLGFKLPNSKGYAAWWSNNPTNNVMTREWLAAGYRTEQVDLAGEKLVFRRAEGRPASNGFSDEVRKAIEPSPRSERHPIFGALKDVTWIAPGVDLTEPADPEWADVIAAPNWGRLPK